ncbi:MAG: crotonase/enoyl-CoA hydratase family protein [Chloroflexota bacterium]
MSDGNIRVEKHGHVLMMGIDRPDKYNAFSLSMWEQLAAAYRQLEDDHDLRCGVVWGEGKHFTAGLDLAQWSGKFANGEFSAPADNGIDPLALTTDPVSKPIIIAVHGICFTVGIELLLATDIRVSADNVRFGQIEIKRGIYPVGGATIRWAMECGWGNAMRYLLTADEFGAEVAKDMGLVQEVVPLGQHVDKAVEIAETVAKQAPLGVYATLRSARRTRYAAEQAAIAALMPELKVIMQSEDAAEGVNSFVERREANFQGK